MSNGDDSPTAAQQDEEDFSIPGFSADTAQDVAGPSQQSPAPTSAPISQPAAAATPSAPDPNQPKVSGRAMFLGNLLKTILSGVQNAPGNPRNPLDRGFMNASPNNQAVQKANVSKALSDADQAKAAASMAQMQALNYGYMMRRQPIKQQQRDMDALGKFTQKVIDEKGEVISEADDPKAAQAENLRLRGTDDRIKAGVGDIFMMPKPDGKGGFKFANIYVPHNDVSQGETEYDNPYFDPEAPEGTINSQKSFTVPAGMATKGIPAFVNNMTKAAQAQTKADSQDYASIAKMPESNPNEVSAKLSRYQSEKTGNTHHYQANKDQTDREIARLTSLHATEQSDDVQKVKAGVDVRAAAKDEAGAKAGEAAVSYADTYLNGKQYSGPGDEALLEKFFELAKPSTGFRMTKQQIDLLTTARSWVEGAKARAGHVEGGILFSDEQRKQIVTTMKALAASKGTGGGTTHSFTFNGKQFAGVPDAVYNKYKGKPGFKEGSSVQ